MAPGLVEVSPRLTGLDVFGASEVGAKVESRPE